MRTVFLFLILAVFAFSCNDEYDYRNFPTAPEELKEFLNGSLQKYMDKDIKNFKEFVKKDTGDGVYYLKRDSYIVLGEYIYPKIDGVWKLHIDEQGRVDEVDFAKLKLYKDPAEDLANEINDDLGNLWLKWDGDAYGYKMVPEYTQLHLDDYYISLDVFIYGSEDDATGLKNSIINLHIINYTHEVNNFLKCLKLLPKN